MEKRSLLSSSRPRGIATWLVIVYSVFLILLGATIFCLGAWLAALGGSWYYLFAGAGLIAVALLMLAGSAIGVWIYLAVLAGTWLWAFWEVGSDGWALVPRVVGPSILGIITLLCLPVLWREFSASDSRLPRRHARGCL